MWNHVYMILWAVLTVQELMSELISWIHALLDKKHLILRKQARRISLEGRSRSDLCYMWNHVCLVTVGCDSSLGAYVWADKLDSCFIRWETSNINIAGQTYQPI